MTKINLSGSNVGAKGLCAVIDTDGTVLPCLATDNGDGTSTLKIDASVIVDSIDIGDVDIKEFPSGNLGQQAKAASLSVAPATDITDTTYIGDIKFGESLPSGSALLGKVSIDQVTANANEVVVKSITAGDTNIGNVDIVTLPSGNLGAQTKASSLCINPATDIADATYIGDIKFGEAAPLDVSYSTGATDSKTIRVKLSTEDLTALENVTIDSSALPAGAATEQGLDDILAKLSADPASQTTLAAILAKIIAAPATEAKQDTIKTAVDAVTTKLSADPSTATLQGTGNASLSSIDGKISASTIGEYNVVLTVVDTEYSQALPDNCKGIEFVSRGGYPVRYAFTTGKVAGSISPYFTLKSNCSYENPITLNLSSKTIYFASDNAGDVVELIVWS